MKSLISEYIDVTALDGKSPSTIRNYRYTLTKFSEWLESQGISDWGSVTKSHVRGYLTHKQQQGAAKTSLNVYHATLSPFFNYLVQEGIRDTNPVAEVKRPRAPIPETALVSAEQISDLLKLESATPFASVRDRLAILIMWDTGVRVAELCGISIDDVDTDAMTFRIYGKGGKYRTVGYGKAVSVALRRYMRARSVHPSRNLPGLLLSRTGPLTPNAVRKMLRLRGDRCGIPGLRPHRLRHSFVHEFLEAGGTLLDLKTVLGHSDYVELMRRYGAVSQERRALTAMRRLSPGDRLPTQ